MLMTNLNSKSTKNTGVTLFLVFLLTAVIAGTTATSKHQLMNWVSVGIPIGVVMCLVFYFIIVRPQRVFQNLLENGIRGKARILESVISGTKINGTPVIKQSLEIHAPMKEPYQATERFLCYPGMIPNTGEYDCLISPKSRKQVAMLVAWQRDAAIKHGLTGVATPPSSFTSNETDPAADEQHFNVGGVDVKVINNGVKVIDARNNPELRSEIGDKLKAFGFDFGDIIKQAKTQQNSQDLASQLAKLTELHKSGELTETEFAQAKSKLLGEE